MGGVIALFASVLVWAAAQRSATLPYRGVLEQNGLPVETARDIRFSLYAAETGGLALWSELHTITPSTGVFSADLGSINDFGTIIKDANALYLEVEVRDVGASSGVVLGTRQKLASVPFAHRAAPGVTFVADAVESTTIDATTIGAASLTSTDISTDALDATTVNSTEVNATTVRANNIDGCYTHYGAHGCAAGYQEVVQGHLGGLESYGSGGGHRRPTLVCINDSAAVLADHAGYNNRLMRSGTPTLADSQPQMTAVHPRCSICCRGGSYTSIGSSNVSAPPSCASGYSAAYSGRVGGIEAYIGSAGSESVGGLCIDGSAESRYSWNDSGYSTRLMRFWDQPTNGGGNGMSTVNGRCSVCVSAP